MTMRVTIENEDSSRTAIVCEETFKFGDGPTTTSRNITTLGPMARQSYYIHAAKRLLVNEDPDAQIASPQEKKP